MSTVRVLLPTGVPPFAIQLVRQVNYGSLESKRYFAPTSASPSEFVEVAEDDLIQANFQKLNSYKNYKCGTHDRFFEVNIYQKDPINKHHWRANLARPASSIDL
ncbi:MFS multidrug transporter [Apiospora hydei]|uniref:MFS multidrug transporter n=1 Tax=Apiospora hydei TaxID=1337664 RepID=A0ABR1WZ92_9PEZI